MTSITLQEFRKISGLSDTAIVWLLANNSLICSPDPEKGLLIDVDSLDYKKLTSILGTKLDEEFTSNKSILSARLSKIVNDNLADIISEAVKSIKG